MLFDRKIAYFCRLVLSFWMATLSVQVVLGEEWAGQPGMRPPGSAQLTAGNGGGAVGNSSGANGALATCREGGVTTAGDLSGGETAPRSGTLIRWHRGAMRLVSA